MSFSSFAAENTYPDVDYGDGISEDEFEAYVDYMRSLGYTDEEIIEFVNNYNRSCELNNVDPFIDIITGSAFIEAGIVPEAFVSSEYYNYLVSEGLIREEFSIENIEEIDTLRSEEARDLLMVSALNNFIEFSNNNMTIKEDLLNVFIPYIESQYNDYGIVYTYSFDNVPVEMCGGLRDSFLDFLKHEGGNIPNTSGLSSNAIFNYQFNYGNGVIFTKNVTGFSLVLDSASSISVNDIVWHWEHVLHPDTGSLLSTSQVSGFRTYNSEGVYDTFHSGYRFYGNWDSPRDYTWDTFSWNIGSTFGLRRVKSGSGYAGSVNWFISESVQPILVFETEEAMAQYLSGQLDFYRIPTDYTGGDIVVDTNIDYDALYDTIRDAVSGLEGASPSDIQQAINDAVSGYLDDIKFNTAETNTWLQRIYNKLEDIRAEVSSGFDWIKTELAALLVVNVVDIVWDDVKEDIEEAAAMAASLKDLAESKFPFSIAKDIGLFLTMFRAEPVEPIFEIPFNLLGNETVVVLDLTSAEDFLPYVRGGFILVFMAGLFGLSIKIIPIISGGA